MTQANAATNDRTAILDSMRARLESAGIGHESIKVFGAIKCNVHVTCSSRNTADKWAMLLGSVFKGARVYVGEHTWNAADNKGTCLRPTMRSGFLVAVAG